MKILLLSIGTRGDCEPFLGVGEMLRARGAEVFCAFPEQYRNLAEETGFPFFSLGSKFLGLLDSNAGRVMTGGDSKSLKKLTATVKVTKLSLPIQKQMLDLQAEIVEELRPDCIIYHSKATYPLPWSLKNNKKAVLLATTPYIIHPVKEHPHIGFPSGFPAALSYKIANAGVAKTLMTPVKKYFKGLFNEKQIKEALFKTPIFYNVSPAIFPRPAYWPGNALVAGFWERSQAGKFHPPQDLTEFLAKHDKIMFITFGSMPNSAPLAKSRLITGVLRELDIPAIINASAGDGLPEPENYHRGLIKFVTSIPYDWAFPRMYAVVHHGGAGTTHSALKAGCASMAIPHTVDQPMWAEKIRAAGAGPAGIPVGKLEKNRLKDKLKDLYENPSYKERAESIARAMREEDFSAELYRFITQRQCHIPDGEPK